MSDPTQTIIPPDRCGDPDIVTVVIPAYNAAKWIGETLASVAAQTYGQDRIEVVVVDDGSSDGTAAVAERYLATTSLRWQVIRQPNRGPGAARNTGYRAGRGRWIQFLDADDLINPEKLEIQLAVAHITDDTVAAVYSSWSRFGEMEARWESGVTVTPRLGNDPIIDQLRGGNEIATGSELYSRTWLDRLGGWDEDHSNGEDHDLRLRITFAGGKFAYAPSSDSLFYYRRHPPTVVSLTTRSRQANAEVWTRLAERIEFEWRRRGELTPARLAFLAEKYAVTARCLADCDWQSACTAIDRAYALYPNYRPKWSGTFGQIAAIIGFRSAVRILVWLRRFRLYTPRVPQFVTVTGPILHVGQFESSQPGTP